jgi:ABC-type bacteriocin/lantibiotic exporter with double-glycine peptidase domain
MGLLKPTKGQILLDGKIDIHHQINKWRKIISYVPQQIYLLDESVEKNIAFGQNTNDIDQTILKNVIDVSKLGSFMRENDKQNYRLGEKGLKISGGQAQRLGVARALYRKPEILLLDESTNGLDYETEKSFLQDLVQLKKNLTIIFVSHREHVKEYADEVLEIEKLNFLRND